MTKVKIDLTLRIQASRTTPRILSEPLIVVLLSTLFPDTTLGTRSSTFLDTTRLGFTEVNWDVPKSQDGIFIF